jgi:hypothetical protein
MPSMSSFVFGSDFNFSETITRLSCSLVNDRRAVKGEINRVVRQRRRSWSI